MRPGYGGLTTILAVIVPAVGTGRNALSRSTETGAILNGMDAQSIKSMRSLRIAGSILLSALLLQAGDFSLKFFGDGEIMLHTVLTFDGKGERLVATAKNESGAPIQKAKICINSASVKKGCLFELWNSTVWAPGGELSWNVTTEVKTANLSHDAMIEEYENVNAPQTLSSAVSGTGAGGLPIRPANPSPPVQQDVLTNEALIKLAKAGVSDGVILGMVKGQPGKFLSSADAVIALKEAGVSDKVIAAVLERSDAPSSAHDTAANGRGA